MGPVFSKPLASRETPIPGVVLFDLPVHGDNRGWFKENWQRSKMTAAGLADFGPVQNNISFNETAGTTRGIHAEPWDKFISVATGRVFGAWVDLREGPSFGAVFTAELDPSTAIFIPRGVGNAFQTLEDGTAYTYLVNDHWSADAQDQYVFLNLADETAAIEWPIPLGNAELSDKDRAHPRLGDVTALAPRRTLVVGADGQLGKALRSALADQPSVEFAGRAELDLLSDELDGARPWTAYDTIINAAAYTAVDAAESAEGRAAAWAVNVAGVAALARVASTHRLTLVHISSDYVFDGTQELHQEAEPFSPLGVYGQTKAAGDAIVATVPRHYILRTSWVIGEGANFVRTMANLAGRGISPSVVNDQIGRLTFTADIAAAILHLVGNEAPFGTYNVTNDGEPQSWADIAADVYALCGRNRADVTGVSTEEYFAGKAAAPRPLQSTLDLAKLRATGFAPAAAADRLGDYVTALTTA
ncbi:MAG: NAD-dependent epimerase/dehydratase family protein [Micrococcaceae bacterium]|uniref:dTDP-4-dehydrorhamnose reductase n=1 Tax=Arthrobacter cheniae TaxID=1258888 RepID=A0A3A5ME86_9MICC|nr:MULTISPECIES: bifunctional dTDP-4-dehydrorhamnose 3,5-epimerase family protein/NAD(P)-dependent oxidoreductase [Arthrobacter]MCU1631592.1 NAD-dependent epimerase/dehydratase family protein [Micrococcaceae bacterium]MEC5198242.1 dTDP-4-dehydrorhamnose reductase/dTDP-4-dehydrorhamnose 3,5-epimerase [Arthrobacter sp. PL16]RJT82035.1 NAD-dependent epimerase/dehydratase family protein [Arthrobacter cheniae]